MEIKTLDSLIDKKDNFEIVGERISAILALEIASQKQLAEAAGKPMSDWSARVFSERADPWEQFESEQDDKSPIVNVWFDGSDFPLKGSDAVKRQKSESTFNIDCYGFGKSSDVLGAGHSLSDKVASLETHRTIRLMRNIIMSSINTYLQMRGLVTRRWVQGITTFQPNSQERAAFHVIAARLPLKVDFYEESPQVEGVPLKYINTQVKRQEDGQMIVLADFDYS